MAATLGAGCRTPAPEPTPAPTAFASPELLTQLAPAFQTWAYVDLRGDTSTAVGAADLVRAAEACLRESEAMADPGPDGLVFCLNQRGFYPSLCSDGVDNDGDGKADHPADAGCASPTQLREDPQCDDKADNDGDGLVDFDGGGRSHPDPECDSASDDFEWATAGRRRR